MKTALSLLLALTSLPSLGQTPTLSVADDGAVHLGDRQLTQRDVYELTGRTDLVEKSDLNRNRRKWLIVSAITSAVVLVGSGVAVLATTPNLATPYCESSTDRYNNECLPQVQLHSTWGTVLLVGGLISGALLGGFAYGMSPDVLTARELEELVTTYNKKTTPPPPPVEVRLTPVLAPGLVGLSLSLVF